MYYFDTSAKQLPMQVRYGMLVIRLREICSRYISWGECHFNIIGCYIKEQSLSLDKATMNSPDSKFHVFLEVSGSKLDSLKNSTYGVFVEWCKV